MGFPVSASTCMCECLSVTIFRAGHTLAKINRFRHLPSNGVIAKIVLRDLNQPFEGQIFLNVNISET